MNFRNKVVVITGASSGIGEASAIKFAKKNAKVVLVARRKEKLLQVQKEISKYTDRKIYVHNKQSKIPLDLLLNKAWAFVSDQSTAGFKAMLAGVPAHFTNKTLKGINSIKEIEDGDININIFYNIAYGQWTLNEMQSGETWEYINRFN